MASGAKQKKKLKSWQRRRIRRTKMILGAVFLCLLIILFIAVLKALAPYKKVDLCDYCTYEYSGYNTKGMVDVKIDEDAVSELMKILRDKYEDALFNIKKCDSEDYNTFYNSLSVTVDSADNLSNGSKFSYTVNYDKALAKKIRLKVENDTGEDVVSGLPVATVISVDQVFDGISLFYEGMSPTISIAIINENVNPYLSDVEYFIENKKDLYSDGEVVRVRALYSDESCLEKHFYIDAPADGCYKDFTIQPDAHYVQSAAELTPELISEAIEAAKGAFTTAGAKEFGVRVYFEANIAPVYVNKESTFEWVRYEPLSAYIKVAKEEVAGQNSNNYNDLDIVFDCTMTQADGKRVNVEAVVRFKDIIVRNDGSYQYNFSEPKIVSASHFDKRIKENVIYNYEDKYTIEKLIIK